MKANKSIIIIILFLILAGGIYRYYIHTKNDSAELSVQKVATEVVWKEYQNTDLGISFLYPTATDESYTLQLGNGDMGKRFGGTQITLPSGTTVTPYATTKDYIAPKDGPLFGTEGFSVKDGIYYQLNRGKPFKITPDEFWTIADGSQVPVIYAKGDYSQTDFVPPNISVLVNMNGKPFTGIGFALYTTGETPPTNEDIELFKKIIGSIKITQ